MTKVSGLLNKRFKAKLKKSDKLKTHGRGNVAHGNVAHQPLRVHPTRGASAHKKAKEPEPRRLQLPGPIVEHPRRGRGKQAATHRGDCQFRRVPRFPPSPCRRAPVVHPHSLGLPPAR